MSESHIAILPDRGVVAVGGADAKGFLDNLVTNDMDLLERQEAIHAALLTPQGKILFEFFVVRHEDGFLLETARASAGELVKRLTMYRLRAKVVLTDASAEKVVGAVWGGQSFPALPGLLYRDPRHSGLGYRLIATEQEAGHLVNATHEAYDEHRISLGVPDAGRDYALGDAFPHEACLDGLGGVSFTKGCFVGQEVVARMQHKTVVRKRVVPVRSNFGLQEGSEIKVGEAIIGRVGSAGGAHGLAMLRLDRALEARAKGEPLTVNGATITVDEGALDTYAAKARDAAR